MILLLVVHVYRFKDLHGIAKLVGILKTQIQQYTNTTTKVLFLFTFGFTYNVQSIRKCPIFLLRKQNLSLLKASEKLAALKKLRPSKST